MTGRYSSSFICAVQSACNCICWRY